MLTVVGVVNAVLWSGVIIALLFINARNQNRLGDQINELESEISSQNAGE